MGGGAWAVRVHIKPFVRWIWLGALLMMLGGFVTAADKRFRRVGTDRVREASPANQALGAPAAAIAPRTTPSRTASAAATTAWTPASASGPVTRWSPRTSRSVASNMGSS